MKKIVLMFCVSFLVASAGVLAQTSTDKSKPGRLIHIAKQPEKAPEKPVERPKDASPPTIQILEPKEVAQRGIKIIPDVDLTVKTGSIKIRGIARDSSGVAIVKINDREAPVKPVEGGLEFSADVLLTFGVNSVEITAIDVHQNVGKETIKVQREVAIVREEPKLPEERIFKGYQVWAAVIGISDYLSPDVTDLRYADRDAESFYKFLITPLEEGGRGVPKTNIRKLLNKEATKTNIQEAIFDFMKNALEEDVAIIYFAGHGAPDPYRPNVPYLLAYDSDLGRPGATAVKMQEIQDAIRDYIKAKKIIVFADACHSAGVSTSVAMRGTANSELINQFLEEIAKAGTSVLTFSASESKEYSQESQQWGGGHGVFTYHILKGLQGDADSDDDEIVRLGELVDYVSLNVRKDTKSLQHPTPSPTPWDRNLPFSVVITGKEK
jgi:hypothetical protein